MQDGFHPVAFPLAISCQEQVLTLLASCGHPLLPTSFLNEGLFTLRRFDANSDEVPLERMGGLFCGEGSLNKRA